MRTISVVELSPALAVAGFVGLLIGAAVTFVWRFSEKRIADVPVLETRIPSGADAVLSVLSSSAVLLDNADAVVKASAPAHALGLINGDRLASAEIMDLVWQVRRDGQVREESVTLSTPRTTHYLAARVAPLSSKFILVLVDDQTQTRRVEAIRRDFVANVSHELKTPIGAIALLAEAVDEARDDPETITRFAGRMQTESVRLTRLVQQIIDLSRLQSDALHETPVDIAIGELLQTACDNSHTEATRKRIDLVQSAETGLWVLGDRDQLQSAVSNLVENAVTYSAEDSRIVIRAGRDGDDVQVTVTDSGIGIEAGEVDRIFERFYRVDPARHRSTGGSGLGLSIVKHVAASHGGRVDVWSQAGVGSSFTLVLPAHTPEDEEDL